MKENDLKNLSVNERVKAMEALWNTFIYEEADIESPTWHGEILQERKESIENGTANFISLDKLKDYFRDKN